MNEFRQDEIPESLYQAQLNEEIVVEEDASDIVTKVSKETLTPLKANDIRYWSDFNRVYYTPRTIHKLPDVPEWEIFEGNWKLGKEQFARYELVCTIYHGRSFSFHH